MSDQTIIKFYDLALNVKTIEIVYCCCWCVILHIVNIPVWGVGECAYLKGCVKTEEHRNH